MNFKSFSLVSFLILILVLFSGCDSFQGQNRGFLNNDKESSSSSSNLGVELNFAQGNPPNSIYKDDKVNFAFVFNNYQEHVIDDLVLKVRGFDSGYVHNLDTDYSSIGEIPKFTKQAGAGIYSGFVVDSVFVNGFENQFNFNPRFDYCYSAKTTFMESVCIPSKQSRNCEIEFSKNQKQNGPAKITINSIDAFNEDELRIEFDLENKGNGEIVNECDFKHENYARNYELKVSAGSEDITSDCKAESGFSFMNGKSHFYCTFKRTMDDSYNSQILVELNYKYEQTTKKEILVKDIN